MDNKHVPTYRFGDFTPEELTLIGLSMLDRVDHERQKEKSIINLVSNIAHRRLELLESLYQEVRSAHMQAIKDGKGNGDVFYG